MILRTVATKTSDRVLKFVCSTSNADFKGDRIYMKGIDFTRFMKNPVFLLQHDRNRVPIGKFLSLEVSEDVLIGEVEFWKNPNDSSEWSEADKESNSIYEMYLNGFMSAVSITTFDIDYYPNDYGGDDILEAMLIEVSAVTVPMNEDALKI